MKLRVILQKVRCAVSVVMSEQFFKYFGHKLVTVSDCYSNCKSTVQFVRYNIPHSGWRFSFINTNNLLTD